MSQTETSPIGQTEMSLIGQNSQIFQNLFKNFLKYDTIGENLHLGRGK